MRNDVGVAIIFFNRPDAVKRVFESVRKAEPRKLFLIQDGSRGEKDDNGVKACREVFKIIDWDCEVYRNYSDVNMGCGRRMSSGISWAFETVEKLIILEDDCVPTQSFYPFCEEMLEKYKDDERVMMISGMNHWGQTQCNADYIFAINGAIWGWATWKRAWDMFDFSASEITDVRNIKYLMSGIEPKRVAKRDIARWIETNRKYSQNEKLSYWAHQWRLVKLLNYNLCIVPRINLISNVGDQGATHAFRGKGKCEFHHMTTQELDFPLKHPLHVIPDSEYDAHYYKEFYPTLLHRAVKKIKRTISAWND